MQKTLLLLAFSLLPFINIFAQSKITGYITDSENEEAVPFASVIVYPEKDTTNMLTGVTTDLEGNFQIENLKKGEYTIRIQVIGYEKEDISLNLKENNEINLSRISLKPATQLIEEVIIEAEKNPVEATSEGIIIQADANTAQEGGTALDLLRNSPSVNIDADGNISLRGADNVNILIDGRNSALANNLEQIPISSIQEIKIITNPGAKYDAQGVAGVIDIRLKKGDNNSKNQGLKGRVQVNIGTNERANASLGLTYKKEKITLFASYNKRNGRRVREGRLWRESDGEILSQTSFDDFKIFTDNVKTGVDYKLTPNATIGFESVLGILRFDNSEWVWSQWENSSSPNSYRAATFEAEGYNWDNAINFRQNFSSKDHYLAISASYSFSERDFPRAVSAFLSPQESILQSSQRTNNDVLRTFGVFQADYTQPLSNGWKLEGGWKTTLRLIENDFLFQDLNFTNNTFERNNGASNRFKYDEQVHAAYFILQKEWERWKINAGVRAEQTIINTTLFETGETNEQNYLTLFPSFLVEYKLTEKQFLRASYNRRINRPNDRWLNPFINVADSLNIFSGNPQLQPEFIDAFEIAYGFNTAKTTFQTVAFYRNIQNWFDFVGRVENGVAFRRPENLNNQVTYGMEFIVSSNIAEWWNINGSITLFEARVDGTNLDSDFSNQNRAWSGKFVSDFTLPKNFSIQITGNYTAPEAEAQGTEVERYYIDLGIKKTLFNNKLSITANLRDVFDSLQREENSGAANFIQNRFRKDETRIFFFGVGYRF